MNVSSSLNKNPRVGHPPAATKQFYRIDPRFGKANSFQRQGHLNNRITIRKDKGVRAARVGKLLGWREPEVHVNGNLSQTLNEPCKYHELPLHVRIVGSTDAIEQSDQVGLATGKTEMAVAQIESLSYGHDCRG